MSIRTRPARRADSAHISSTLRPPSRRFMLAWIAMFGGSIAAISITLKLLAALSIGAAL